MRSAIPIVLILGLSISFATAQEMAVDTEVSLSPEELPFHHVARYEIRVAGPAEATIEVAPWAASMPGLRIQRQASSSMALSETQQQLTQEFLLTPSMPRNYALPPVTILVDGTVASEIPSRSLVVRDLFPEELEAVRELVPPLSLEDVRSRNGARGWTYLLALFVLSLLVGVGAWYWARKRFAARSRAAWAFADSELGELLSLLENRQIRGEVFYVKLSSILRGYVAARYGVPIIERSTQEVEEQISDQLPVDAVQREALIELLQAFDGVKFALRQPPPSQMAREASQARDFVAATVPVHGSQPTSDIGQEGAA